MCHYIKVQLRQPTGTVNIYEVPFEVGMNALSVLNYIYEHLDRKIHIPLCLCRIGKCGACAIRINGRVQLGCAAKIEPGHVVLIEPIK